MAIMNLNLLKETTKDELNEFLRDIALHSNLQTKSATRSLLMRYPVIFVGTREAGIVDANATIAQGKNCVLYLWYDNEFGYCCQVARMVYKMVGVHYQLYPKEQD